MATIDIFLEKIISSWLKSDLKEVVEVAEKLKSVLESKENNIKGDSSEFSCSPPPLDKVVSQGAGGDILALIRFLHSFLNIDYDERYSGH